MQTVTNFCVPLLIWYAVLSTGYSAPTECCDKKTVGGVEYYLYQDSPAQADPSCLNGCIYKKESSNNLFCFAHGDGPVVCLDKGASCSCSGMNGKCRIDPNPTLKEGQGCCCVYSSGTENRTCRGQPSTSHSCILLGLVGTTMPCPANCSTKECCEATNPCPLGARTGAPVKSCEGYPSE